MNSCNSMRNSNQFCWLVEKLRHSLLNSLLLNFFFTLSIIRNKNDDNFLKDLRCFETFKYWLQYLTFDIKNKTWNSVKKIIKIVSYVSNYSFQWHFVYFIWCHFKYLITKTKHFNASCLNICSKYFFKKPSMIRTFYFINFKVSEWN